MKASVPADSGYASYSSQFSAMAVIRPRVGPVSGPSTRTESPSASVPCTGIMTLALVPASTRPVTAFGSGGLFATSSAITVIRTCADAVCSSESLIS